MKISAYVNLAQSVCVERDFRGEGRDPWLGPTTGKERVIHENPTFSSPSLAVNSICSVVLISCTYGVVTHIAKSSEQLERGKRCEMS